MINTIRFNRLEFKLINNKLLVKIYDYDLHYDQYLDQKDIKVLIDYLNLVNNSILNKETE